LVLVAHLLAMQAAEEILVPILYFQLSHQVPGVAAVVEM
jgi:hypothetical protein